MRAIALLSLALIITAPAQALAIGNPLSSNPVYVWEGNTDYSATAGSLLQCGGLACGIGGANCDGLSTSTATLDDIPETDTLRIVYAQLTWAASTPSGAAPDMQVTLVPPGGDPIAVDADPERTEAFTDAADQSAALIIGGACPTGANFSPEVSFYATATEVTGALRAHREAGGTLNGLWTLQDADIPGARDNDPDTVAAAVASIVVGAWSLLVVYEDEPGNLPLRRVYYYQGFELNVGQDREITTRGFLAPPDPVVDVTYLVFEGDDNIQGDSLEVNGRPVQNGCNPQNNVFNDTVSSGRADGECVRGVRGVDLDTYRVEGAINAGDEEARVRFRVPQGNLLSPGEQIFTHWLVLAFDHRLPDFDSVKPEKEALPPSGSEVSPGSIIEYAIVVENEGGDVATNTIVTDDAPEGSTYVMGSARLNNRPLPEPQPGINPLAGGLNLGQIPEVGAIAPGERHLLQFQVQVDWETPEDTELVNIARIVADGIEEVETDPVTHTVGPLPDGGIPDMLPPPEDAGVDLDMSLDPADAGVGAPDMSMARDMGPILSRDDAMPDPCGRGTRLDPETGQCVSLCGPGLRWDPFCVDGGQCVQENDPPCNAEGGSGDNGCDCQSSGGTGVWLWAVALLGLLRRRRAI
ncbi:MAG: DUF11 domain-containing protein [Bradymonadia bacterium]